MPEGTLTSPSFAPATQAPHDPGAATSVLHTPSGPTIPLTKLAPEAALRRLELTVVRRLEGFLHGDHLGLLPGPGSDTNDARPYQPGQDDVRMMDWAVTARTTVPHVRDTMADRELEVWGLLDVTPSMNWGTEGITKRDLGIAAIATIGFLSQRMGDRFGGLMMLPDRIKRLPARSGRTALYGMLRQMLTEPIVPDNAPGDLELVDGIEQMARSQRRRRHGHAQFGVQIVASAREGLIAGLVDLDIQITVRTASRTGFATPGHADTGSRGHSGRDVDINGGMHALAALAVAFAARRGDHSAEALTARARGGGHHVAQEGALHALNGALAIALRAGHRPGALGAA